MIMEASAAIIVPSDMPWGSTRPLPMVAATAVPVAAPAKLRNLQITSEPADFLMPGRGGNFAQSGYFTIVSLDLNQEFIDVLEIGDEVPVKIKMKFSTQFEKNVEYEYESTIIM